VGPHGAVTERVMKAAPCPVICARSLPAPAGHGRRHVTCGLDLAKVSSGILEYATAVALALDADLLVLHVVRPSETRNASDLLAAAAKASRMGARMKARVVKGTPHQQILAAAHECGSHLIVVGSHGGGIADRQFLGSTTLHLLREAPCSVLVVPAPVSRRPWVPAEKALALDSRPRGPETAFRLRSWRG
jgi:nucleotide-binding universal stress UspA family protein